MKPRTPEAMRDLIAQVRAALPFEATMEALCAPGCRPCAVKLLEYLAMELEEWEGRLDAGEVPTLGDLQQLAERSRKIHRALERHGLVSGTP